MPDNPVMIIAEAGVNHNGDIKMAEALIDVAAKAGVDYVKFQTFLTEELIDPDAPKAQYQIENDKHTTQFEMLKALELPFEAFVSLKAIAESRGIGFLSTPFDPLSLDFLVDELDLPILKIGSGEVGNIPFLKKVGEKRRDVILSTGMADLEEVRTAYDTLQASGAKTIALMHCTSSYPAPYDSVNLRAMVTMKQTFGTRVGYSDHTLGAEISVAAVALGAQIIEKHFTLNKDLPGPDHKASMPPDELTHFVACIRNTETALAGSGVKQLHAVEAHTKTVVTKGIYTKVDINKGEKLSAWMLALKRPSGDIHARDFFQLLGKTANRPLKKGDIVSWDDLD